MHVLFGSQEVKYPKSGQKKEKFENAATCNTFTVLRGCSLKKPHKYLPLSSRSNSLQKMALQAQFFLTYRQINVSVWQKYILFDEIPVTRA